MPEASTSPRRGRRAAASREDVLEAVMHRYLRGRRIDVKQIAAQLGLGRTTVYRWFGSREKLIGQVVAKAGEPALRAAREQARGTGGQALLETFDSFNRFLADNRVLRTFVERERDAALRIITSGAGTVHFYAGVLGLRLVKKSVNQDDPTVYHLFYGDEEGSPGADLTFFEYPGVPRGSAGAGMVQRIVWRVGSAQALGFWAERLEAQGLGTSREDARLVFSDPEGLAHELRVVQTEEEGLAATSP